MKAKYEINIEDIRLEYGLPDELFLHAAWASEPLTNKLVGTNIPAALAPPDASMSLVAQYEEQTIGQCSTNETLTYWSYLDRVDVTNENKSTQTFVKIHQKGIADERKYLEEINESIEHSRHNAGIAALPRYRGNNLGFFMCKEQIKVCKEQQATTLFCETTNRYSAATVQNADFSLIAEYRYEDLARELDPQLNDFDDSFSIWCLKL